MKFTKLQISVAANDALTAAGVDFEEIINAIVNTLNDAPAGTKSGGIRIKDADGSEINLEFTADAGILAVVLEGEPLQIDYSRTQPATSADSDEAQAAGISNSTNFE